MGFTLRPPLFLRHRTPAEVRLLPISRGASAVDSVSWPTQNERMGIPSVAFNTRYRVGK